jgi:hypothetical protein
MTGSALPVSVPASDFIGKSPLSTPGITPLCTMSATIGVGFIALDAALNKNAMIAGVARVRHWGGRPRN